MVSCYSFPFNPIFFHFLKFKLHIVKLYYLDILLVPETENWLCPLTFHKNILQMLTPSPLSFQTSNPPPHSLFKASNNQVLSLLSSIICHPFLSLFSQPRFTLLGLFYSLSSLYFYIHIFVVGSQCLLCEFVVNPGKSMFLSENQ